MPDVEECFAQFREDEREGRSLGAEYSRVFGHTARGLVCPCETEYGDDNKYQQPQQLADVAGYYLAFGLTPVASTALRHDHVACECEFMAFLNLKQALFMEECAATDGGAETLEVTRRAERTFLRDHLGPFGRAFASSLASETVGPFYRAWGMLFRDWLETEHARHGLDIPAGPLPLRTELSDDAPMACGSASDLIQILRP
jgi:TorA maturation chaperone TorD